MIGKQFADTARTDIDGLMSTGVRRRSLINPFVPYLRRRWSEGCVNAATLFSEIKDQGFGGSPQTVRRYLQYWRVGGVPAEDPSTITPRKVTGWIMRRPNTLTDHERAQLENILDRSAEVSTAQRLAAGFAVLLRDLQAASWTHGPSRPKTAASARSAPSRPPCVVTGTPWSLG